MLRVNCVEAFGPDTGKGRFFKTAIVKSKIVWKSQMDSILTLVMSSRGDHPTSIRNTAFEAES